MTAGTLPAWGYLQYCVPDDDTVYVMNAPQDAGGNILLAPIDPGQYGQLFQFASDGHILLSTAGYVAGLTTTTNLTKQAYDVSESGEHDQVWEFGGPPGQRPQIVNRYYGSYLGIAGDDPEGSPPIIASFTQPAGYWQLFPANPLDAILADPPVGFPQFSGGQLAAYNYIETSLVPPPGEDLRSEYTNLNAPLTQWSLQIAEMSCPPEISSKPDCDAVRQQLGIELSAVVSVQMLFANYSAFQGLLLMNQQNELAQCGLDVAIGEDTETNATAVVVLQGILYTILQAIPEIGGVLGNIVNTAISGAFAAGTVSLSPTRVAYAQLWSTLLQTFLAVGAQAASDETEILSDWGKLQKTSALTVRPGPDSLMWPVTAISQLLAASKPGYEMQFMKILLPSYYQIYKMPSFVSPPGTVPSYARWSGNGLNYWIAESTNCDAAPSSAAMNDDVWGNGAERAEFFQCLNGWNFATAVQGNTYVNVTISNQTTYAIVAQATAIGHATIMPPAEQTISPYTSAELTAAIKTRNLEVLVEIVQCDTGLIVGAFTITLENVFGEDYIPVVSGLTSAGGFALSQPICNQGADSDNYSLAVQVTVGLAAS